MISRGFTLIEVLIAMSSVSLIMLATYAGMWVAFDLREKTEDRLGVSEAAMAALDVIAADLDAAPVPNGVLADLFTGEDELGPDGDPGDVLTFRTATGRITLDPDAAAGSSAGGGLVRGGVSAAAEKRTQADLQEVAYVIERSAIDDQMDLVRLVTRNLLAEQTPEPERQVIARNVAAFDVQYDDGSEFVETWDSTQQESGLPAAVRLVLVMNMSEEEQVLSVDRNKRRATFVRLVRLPHIGGTGGEQAVQRR